MALMDLIEHRHSIRSYTDKPVERQKIMKCLEAARLAPSASNRQTARFVVVDEPVLRKRLCDEAFSGVFSVMKFPREAPVIVAAVGNPPGLAHRAGNILLRTNFGLIDMGIAIEHFVLQADELGLGTCWMGLFDESKVKKTLGIPPGLKVAALLTVGYFDEALARGGHNRKKIEEMGSFNGWKENWA
jgi:nitroreductase